MADSNDKNNSGESDEENPLDRTRLDVPLSGAGIDATHTEIRVLHPNDSIELKLKKQRRSFDKILGWFRSTRPIRQSFFPRLPSFLGSWKWGGRFLNLLGGIFLLSLFLKAFLTAHRIDSPFQWILLGVFLFLLLISFAIFFLRMNASLFVGIPFLLFLVFLSVNVIFYPTADPTFFSVFGKTPAFSFNLLFLVLILLQVLWILFLPFPLIFRLLWVLPGLYGFIGPLLNFLRSVPLEGGWLGAVRWPIFVALQVFFPLSFLLNLFVLVLGWTRLKARQRLAWGGINLALLLLTSFLGMQLMQNHRIPNGLSLVSDPPLGVGRLETDFQRRVLQLNILSPAGNGETDSVPHYRMTLLPLPDPKKTGKNSFTLKVTDPFGFPVLFLDKADFSLEVDDASPTSWSLAESDAEGEYRLEIVFSQTVSQAEKISQPLITAPAFKGLIVASPMEGDYFDESLPVALDLSFSLTSPTETVKAVHYFIDDTPVLDQISPPYNLLLDTKNLGAGEHQFRVTADLASGRQLESKIKVMKGIHPLFQFDSPTFGQYLQSQNPVTISVKSEKPLASVDLFLDDQKINEWPKPTESTLSFNWDTTSLAPGNYLLRVRGKTEEGIQGSAWVSVLTGEGSLKIQPPDGKMKPPYEKVLFLLDASISEEDGWKGRSKWEWEKSLLKLEPVPSKLKGVEVGIVLFGAKVPYAYSDCEDAQILSPMNDFNRAKITGLLERSHPLGVSPLAAGLEAALNQKPQKIILVTDGVSSCGSSLSSSVKNALGTFPKIPLDVIFLGEEEELSFLKQLASMGGGEFWHPADGKELGEKTADLLSLKYQIFQGNKKILEAPLDGKGHSLRPGDYILKISMTPPLSDFPLAIRNGQTTSFKLVLQGGNAKMVDASPPIQ